MQSVWILCLLFHVVFFQDVERTIADVVVYSGDIFAYDADCDKLNAANEQHAED